MPVVWSILRLMIQRDGCLCYWLLFWIGFLFAWLRISSVRSLVYGNIQIKLVRGLLCMLGSGILVTIGHCYIYYRSTPKTY